MDTLYVSVGINDTWSNHMTPFLVVVSWSLAFASVPFACKTASILVQFETSEALQEHLRFLKIEKNLDE